MGSAGRKNGKSIGEIPLHILHLIPTLSGGGAEQQLSYLASEQARIGHTVSIGYLCEGLVRPEDLSDRVSLHRIRAGSHYSPAILLKITRLIHRIQPDVVQTWCLLMDVMGGAAALLTGTPWVLREASSIDAYSDSWKRRLRCKVASGASAIISNSSSGNHYWKANCRGGSRFVIPNGVPVEKIANADFNQSGVNTLPPAGKYVVFAGRLIAGKNLENLIKALAIVCRRKPIQAVICGDGPLRESLEKQIRELGLASRIHMPGRISRELLWPLIRRAAAFTFFSEYEGMPNVVLEAMACRCPLVVSDIPAHRAFLDESMATLVDHLDPKEIAQAIIKAAEKRDEERIERAWRRVQDFTIPSMAAEYDKTYQSILSLQSYSDENNAAAEA